MADQGRALASLGDQSDPDQGLEMMRERRRRDVEPFLKATDRRAFPTGAHQGAVDLQPGRVAQRLEARSGIVELHAGQCRTSPGRVNGISRSFEIKIAYPAGRDAGLSVWLGSRNVIAQQAISIAAEPSRQPVMPAAW